MSLGHIPEDQQSLRTRSLNYDTLKYRVILSYSFVTTYTNKHMAVKFCHGYFCFYSIVRLLWAVASDLTWACVKRAPSSGSQGSRTWE